MPGTQRRRRHASRRSALPATVAVGTLLIAGIVGAGVLPGRATGGQSATLQDVAGPVGSPQSASPSAAAGADDDSGTASPAVAESATVAVPAPVVPASTAPVTVVQAPPVVPGTRLSARTQAQLDAEAAALAAVVTAQEAARVDRESFTFKLGTFNVLGSQHTAPGGDHPRYPPASARSVAAVRTMARHRVDVLGTQELQPDQLNAITSRTGMAAYPGYRFGVEETDNSILYDTSRFQFVSGGSFTIRFMNADRPQTVLRLRERETGREMYFVNMHASAGEGRYAASRRAGHLRAIAEVNKLKESGLPVFLTGDMNDREEFFCRVAPPTGLVAAIGGSTQGGCNPAPALAVDWVMATSGVEWTTYWEDRSTLGRISDHHFVSATARVPGRAGGDSQD